MFLAHLFTGNVNFCYVIPTPNKTKEDRVLCTVRVSDLGLGRCSFSFPDAYR